MNRKQIEMTCKKALKLYENTKDILFIQQFLGHKHIRTTFNFVMAKRNLNKQEEL